MTPDSALLVAIVSAFCFAVAEMFTRNALRFSTPITASILSIAGQFILLTFLIALTGKFSSLHWEGVLWFLLAGFMNPFLFVAFYFVGIQRIGVARSAPLKSSGPIITAILAFFLLGEHLKGLQYVGIILAVGGIIIISAEGLSRVAEAAAVTPPSAAGGTGNPHPEGSPPKILDYLFPLLAGIAAAGGSVLYKLSLEKMPSPLLGVWVTTTTGLLMYPFLGFFFPPGRRFGVRWPGVPWLVLSGLTAGAAVYGMALAFHLGQVSIVFTLIQTSPLMVILLSLLFLRRLENITPKLVFGACLTVGGGILVGLF